VRRGRAARRVGQTRLSRRQTVEVEGQAVPITFTEAKAIVYAAEAAGWTVGTYKIARDGYEDATHYLVVRGVAEAMGNDPDARFVIAGGGRWRRKPTSKTRKGDNARSRALDLETPCPAV
jgi:hypothetical protein